MPSRYNLIENGDFRHGQANWLRGSTFTSADTYTTGSSAVPQLDSTVYKIVGHYAYYKRTSQDVTVSGNAGDSFVFGAWAKGNAVPAEWDGSNPREFSVRGDKGTVLLSPPEQTNNP